MIRVLLLTFLGAMIDGNLLTYDFHKFQLPYSVLFRFVPWVIWWPPSSC